MDAERRRVAGDKLARVLRYREALNQRLPGVEHLVGNLDLVYIFACPAKDHRPVQPEKTAREQIKRSPAKPL